MGKVGLYQTLQCNMNNKIIELLWAESGNAISSRGDIMGKNMGHFQIGDSWRFMEILRNSI